MTLREHERNPFFLGVEENIKAVAQRDIENLWKALKPGATRGVREIRRLVFEARACVMLGTPSGAMYSSGSN